MDTDLLNNINQSLEIELAPAISEKELREQMVVHINHLINTNFEKLVFYLYRIDVNEKKIRRLLEQKEGEDAAGLIADLIIERQVQKIASRKIFKKEQTDMTDEMW
jgi:hypothetical protein